MRSPIRLRSHMFGMRPQRKGRIHRVAVFLAPALLIALALQGASVAWAAAGTVTRFPLPAANSFPTSITTGPDGALWFTESSKIGRITTSGALREFSAPTGASITSGPDGALWFTEPGPGKIGRITTAGAVSEFLLPANAALGYSRPTNHPQAITKGPDGALWFTVAVISNSTLRVVGGKIDRITTGGAVTEFSLPAGTTKSTIPKPTGITTGPDGALWFADSQEGKIWRITTGGALTHFSVPQGAPSGITKGPDGALWFTASSAIGRITTAGAVTAFPVTGGPNGVTVGSSIAAGPDGNLWFSDYDLTSSNGSLLRSTTAGAITKFAFPTYNEIDGITAGPDGAMWFSLNNNQTGASAIGRITTA